MNIVILGAGRVGESVAESLASERNDITVVDTDPARLQLLQDRLDLRGVAGNGIQPSVLQEAGIADADLFIACAPMDETNLVACKVAKQRFSVPTAIARVRSPEFVDGDAVPVRHFGVVLPMAEWQALADKLTAVGTKFIIEPHVRFKGLAGEQATFFFLDPSGNALEFKAFADLGQLFAKQ